MLTRSPLTNPSGNPQIEIVRSDPLPQWEHLPPERQRELVLVLATLLVKRLPEQTWSRKEVQDE
jgi:hypothetical protein